MHCAVPFFCARSGTEGEAGRRCGEWVVRAERNASRSLRACVGAAWASEGLRREWVVRSAGNASHSLRACIGTAVAIESARRGRVAVRGREEVFGGECIAQSAGVHRAACGRASALRGGAEVLGKGVSLCGVGEELRRGMCCGGGEECIAQPAGVRLGCGGGRKCSGRACRCAETGVGLRWGMCCEVGGCASARGGGAEVCGKGVRKCSGSARRCAGAGADLRRGMCCEVGGFNALSPQPLARTRIIIYTSALPTP